MQSIPNYIYIDRDFEVNDIITNTQFLQTYLKRMKTISSLKP